ncbi:gene transfer agent family protein [Rhizobium sp. PL01]|uniref:gene transfer agent family protein n=1 Tax=Rhizobium sp. PL01 TaxID=3085631 RepID=UPI0029810E08|nr:gene transfer agent family protein [Rhizobium sp. PL01]MDW5314081.1 gene transfer agent family protein [Rhizobium sp. PL01]
MIHHTAYFGDGKKTFALTPEMILELDRKTGVGIAALYGRFMRQDFHFNDMIELIRTGLIGGGTSPAEAQTLVDLYAKPRPVMEIFPLAFDILDARWNGKPDDTERVVWTSPGEAPAYGPLVEFGPPQDELRHAAETGDMTAAINDALVQVAE